MQKVLKTVIFGMVLVLLAIMNAKAEQDAAVADQPEKTTKTQWAGMDATFSGLTEVECMYEDLDYDDPALKNESSSDFSLATIELGMDVRINPCFLGHVLLLYEEEPDAEIEVDEAYMQLENPAGLPLYVTAGRRYLPFGRFESHFISDPLTLELGEIRETAVVGGYADECLNVFFGVFNGDVDETDDRNDHVNHYVAGFTVTVADASNFQMMFGGSYLSNLADSDTLKDEIVAGDGDIADTTAGCAAFASLRLMEKLFFEAEILLAADEFAAGELSFDSGNDYQPKTSNLELAYLVTDNFEVAARYGGSDDCGDLLPEKQIGGAVSYAVSDLATLSAEIQRGEFENGDAVTTVTGQLAVGF